MPRIVKAAILQNESTGGKEPMIEIHGSVTEG